VEQFQGIMKKSKARALANDTMPRSQSEPIMAPAAAPSSGAAATPTGVGKDSKQVQMQQRFKQFRYVRKIEGPLPPLTMEPLIPDEGSDSESDRDGRPDDAMVRRNMRSTRIASFAPTERQREFKRHGAQITERQAEAKGRRMMEEEMWQDMLLQRAAQYDARLANLGARKARRSSDEELKVKVKRSSPEERMEALRRLQTALAVVSFFHTFSQLATKYQSLRVEYEEALHRESAKQGLGNGGGVNSVAIGMSAIVLGDQFIQVAVPKLRAVWSMKTPVAAAVTAANGGRKASIKDDLDAFGADDGTPSVVASPSRRRSISSGMPDAGGMLAAAGQRRRGSILGTAGAGKEGGGAGRRRGSVMQALEVLNEEDLVKMPTPEEARKILHVSNMIRQRLLARVHIKRARKDASVMLDAMKCWWNLAPAVLMHRFTVKVYRVQRFLRWARRRLHQVRDQVDATWYKAEHDLLAVQVKAGTLQVSTNANRQMRRMASKKDPRGGYTSPGSKQHPMTVQAQLEEQQVRMLMLPATMRQAVIYQELHKRRRALLPKLAVWKLNMETYNTEVREWRMHREACKTLGVPNDLTPPILPFAPTHIPAAVEITELVKKTREEGYHWDDDLKPSGHEAHHQKQLRRRTERLGQSAKVDSPKAPSEDSMEVKLEPWEEAALMNPPPQVPWGVV